MIAFYNKYPEFQSTPFYLTGESYAGKYIPQFARRIIDYNNANPPFKIPLVSCLIGDPFTSPIQQRTHMYVIAKGLDIVDKY